MMSPLEGGLMHWSERRASVVCGLLAAVAVTVPLACRDPSEPVGRPKVGLTRAPDVVPAAAPQTTKGKARIKSLVLSATTFTLGGPAPTYTVGLQNNGADLANIALQGEVVQDTADYRGAGGTNVLCGAASGVLPKGNCSMTSLISVSNLNGGAGWLVGGAAIFRLTLFQFDSSGTPTLDVREVPVTLNGILITSITDLSGDTLRINIDSIPYTITFNNSTGATQDSVVVKGTIEQFGHATRAAGSRTADCAPIPGMVPIGSCTMSMFAHASNPPIAPDTLVAGTALLHVDIVQKTVAIVRDRRTFVVELK
jgi:hypothetical protein